MHLRSDKAQNSEMLWKNDKKCYFKFQISCEELQCDTLQAISKTGKLSANVNFFCMYWKMDFLHYGGTRKVPVFKPKMFILN